MTLQRPAAARPSPTAVQREHELSRALEAARTLQARLEMLGDRPDDVRAVRLLRDSLAVDVGGLLQAGDQVVDGPPCQDFSALNPASDRNDDGSSS